LKKSRPSQTRPSRAQVSRQFAAAIRGKSAAIAELLEIYRPLLLKVANTELGSDLRRRGAASDLVQNSIIKGTLAFPSAKFHEPHEVVSWLCKILHNELAMHRRYQTAKKRDFRREQPLESTHARVWLDHRSLRSREETLSRQEEIEYLRRAFDRLPDHYRMVLTWRDVDGLRFKEMAARLNRECDATRMLYERARKKLKTELRKIGDRD
jgi:RNA polymerase sigma-70 factor (ECF subfamily)